MYNLNRRDYFSILNMLDSIEKIKQYSVPFSSADEFYNATQAFDASLMNFIILGEMVERLSDELINATDNEISWYKIKGFRNVLAHDYFGVDAEEVWQIIHNSLPEFESQLKRIATLR